jgi:hypothetical protein
MIASVFVRADAPSRRRELREAMRLALVPFGVAIALGLLLFPRRAIPDSVPLPIADRRGLARTVAADHELAERARHEPLPGPVRALGSALRVFHALEVREADLGELGTARRSVDTALVEALAAGEEPLLQLRAVQLEGFLAEIHTFASSGVESGELAALGGGFVRSMRREGWCDGHTLAPPESALRALFKQMWGSFLQLDGRPRFDPSLDEERALYAFFLSHPHPSQTMRDALIAARRGANGARACEALAEAERAARETWRLERIARFATIDPTYPAAYARGVASFGRGKYGEAASAFRSWLRDHPDGPLALRAQSFLLAALDAERVE